MLIPILFPSSEELLVSSCIFIISFHCVASYTKRIVSESITHAATGKYHLSSMFVSQYFPMPVIVANECTKLVLLNATLAG
jgi:hypothetical protein